MNSGKGNNTFIVYLDATVPSELIGCELNLFKNLLADTGLWTMGEWSNMFTVLNSNASGFNTANEFMEHKIELEKRAKTSRHQGNQGNHF